MFKSLLLCAASLVVCGSINASELQDNVGIGLGTMIFGDRDGLISQISAATTNGSFGNQTFAISSGTLGAKRPSSFVQNEQMKNFVKDNMDGLARNVAAGSGETLDTLAELMNVQAADRAAFAKTLQANFSHIFTSATVTHTEVLENLEAFAPAV
jgi:hypothetical protein